MDKEVRISEEELNVIQGLRAKAAELATRANKAVAEANQLVSDAKVADLEAQVLIRNVYLKYELKANAQIDDTGLVKYPEDGPSGEVEPVEDKVDDAVVVETTSTKKAKKAKKKTVKVVDNEDESK